MKSIEYEAIISLDADRPLAMIMIVVVIDVIIVGVEDISRTSIGEALLELSVARVQVRSYTARPKQNNSLNFN